MDYRRQQEGRFPWQVPVLAAEIALLVVIAVLWAVRLFKKGKELKTRAKFSEASEEVWPTKGEEGEVREKELLRKSKELRKARLSYNEEEIGEKEIALKNYLASEHERIQRSEPEDARRSMMIIIRTVLIQNPYDHIGRSMASDAKKIFLRQVLKETNLIHKLQGLLKIPSCLTRREKAKQFLILIPVILAVWGTAQKGFFYLYDIYTDVEVIRELDSMNNLTMPDVPREKIKKFLLEDVKKEGVPALRNPCEFLDVLEEIPANRIPFYKEVVMDIANVRWNPARNSTFEVRQAFEIAEILTEIYADAIKSVGAYDLPSKPSDIPGIVREMKRLMQTAEDQLKDADSGVTGFLAGIFTSFDAEKFLPNIQQAKKVLEDVDNRVLKHPLLEHVFKKADEVYANRDNPDKTYAEQLRIVSMEISKNLTLKSNEQLENCNLNLTMKDPFAQHLNCSQIMCRSFVSELFKLTEDPDLEKLVVHSFTSNKSEHSADGVAEEVNAKSKFLTLNIIMSVKFFLVLNMGWTLLIELRNTLADCWYSKHLPLVTNFRLICQENDPNSPLMTSRKNSSNEYVVKSSQRHSINILEATHETVSTINVQIALWIYMSTYIVNVKRVFKDTFDVKITNNMLNLNNNDFTDFASSAMMASLVAGIFSLTFAQYKQYMTRHEKDTDVSGKIVYFLSCVFNSFAIFLSQICYFIVGLPSFICILIYVIRLIVNFDKYDPMPDSVPGIIVFLVITVVILPLKLIPIKFGEMINFLTERFFLHEKYHTNERNRSGYDVPGFKTALFMFLPSSHNDLSHVDNKESFPNPGFYYFSKDPLSRELYRLRFEIQLFCKVLMHTFYLVFTFLLINTIHLLLLSSTVLSTDYWVSKLHDQDMWQARMGNLLESLFNSCFLSSVCPHHDAPPPAPLLPLPAHLLQALPPLGQGGSLRWFRAQRPRVVEIFHSLSLWYSYCAKRNNLINSMPPDEPGTWGRGVWHPSSRATQTEYQSLRQISKSIRA